MKLCRQLLAFLGGDRSSGKLDIENILAAHSAAGVISSFAIHQANSYYPYFGNVYYPSGIIANLSHPGRLDAGDSDVVNFMLTGGLGYDPVGYMAYGYLHTLPDSDIAFTTEGEREFNEAVTRIGGIRLDMTDAAWEKALVASGIGVPGDGDDGSLTAYRLICADPLRYVSERSDMDDLELFDSTVAYRDRHYTVREHIDLRVHQTVSQARLIDMLARTLVSGSA